MSADRQEEVTPADIARIAGVGRAAVSNWRRRYRDFPRPVGGARDRPLFSRADVVAWLNSTGRTSSSAAGQPAGASFAEAGPAMESEAARTSAGELLAQAMAALLPDLADRGDSSQIVLDPACGTGTALAAVAERFGGRIRLAGQDADSVLAAAAGLALGTAAGDAQRELHAGDSLLDNRLAPYLGRAAAVVCVPPARSGWPARELAADYRWEFGIPGPQDAGLAWVQHCYAHLRPHGAAVVALPSSACVRPSGGRIRDAMVRSGALRAVIGLPAGMIAAARGGACLWVLRRPALHGGPDLGPVAMADLSGLADPADVPRDPAGWEPLLQGADPVASRLVERIGLLGGESLLPSRYAGSAAVPRAEDLARALQRLSALYTTAGRALAEGTGAGDSPSQIAYVTVDDLARAGVLAVRPRDVTPRAGDVLLRTLGRLPVVASGTGADDEGIAQVIEIDQAHLDAHFVAGFLRAEAGAVPVAATNGAIRHDVLLRCRIPRIPLAEQRRYGAAFRRLRQMEATLANLGSVSGQVLGHLADGLASGALGPGDIPGRTPQDQEGPALE